MVVRPRHTRYQGAILHAHQILLIQHHIFATAERYWLIPGGGLEPPETETACVAREMREETGLEVRVERLLLHEPADPADTTYQAYKTYLCTPLAGEARPGYEPEPDAAAAYAIAAVGWFDLRAPETWPAALRAEPLTYPLLTRLRSALGYL